MDLFLDSLALTALFAFVVLPAAVGFAHERRITRQLRDAERREAAPTGTEGAALPRAGTAQCPLLS